MDIEEVEYRLKNARLLGSKGTTGTQASFLELLTAIIRNANSLIR